VLAVFGKTNFKIMQARNHLDRELGERPIIDRQLGQARIGFGREWNLVGHLAPSLS
jgi:hypothetical protein